MKRVVVLVIGAVSVAVGFASCLMTPRDVCHEKLVSDFGCCPLCEDNCEVDQELIVDICGENFDADEDEDE